MVRRTNIVNYNDESIENYIDKMFLDLKYRIESFELTLGSGWTYEKTIGINVDFWEYKVRRGSSYIKLPKEIDVKKACINIKNDDNFCFDLKKNLGCVKTSPA